MKSSLENILKNKKLKAFLKDREEAFYLYDLDAISNRFEVFKSSFSRNIRVHYAMKANNHPKIMKLFASKGCGVDVVSSGELKEALESGFKAKDIIFSGVGKSKSEIQLAIEKEIGQINIESPQELIRIGEIAGELDKDVRVAWRMNPDVNPETHPYIKTGFRENKFGMDDSFLPELKNIIKDYPRVKLVGLTIHIGSQIRDTDPFVDAIHKVRITYDQLKSEGFELETFDIGGGLGIGYQEDKNNSDEELIKIYGNLVSQLFSDFDGQVLCEPGRVLVGSFGSLLTKVEYIKKTPYKNFAIVNTGMHHLMRPCLYQAHHQIVALKGLESNDDSRELYDVVGPICESSDVLGFDRALPKLEQGDWLAIADAGAYGRVMASNYNSHGLPEEYFLSEL